MTNHLLLTEPEFKITKLESDNLTATTEFDNGNIKVQITPENINLIDKMLLDDGIFIFIAKGFEKGLPIFESKLICKYVWTNNSWDLLRITDLDMFQNLIFRHQINHNEVDKINYLKVMDIHSNLCMLIIQKFDNIFDFIDQPERTLFYPKTIDFKFQHYNLKINRTSFRNNQCIAKISLVNPDNPKDSIKSLSCTILIYKYQNDNSPYFLVTKFLFDAWIHSADIDSKTEEFLDKNKTQLKETINEYIKYNRILPY